MPLTKARPRGRPKTETPKLALTVRYDTEVVAAFRATGKGWQTRMNAALRDWLKANPQVSNPMHHRHLNHHRLTLAAIDDVISRGRWHDWAELRRAVLADGGLLDKVERVCRPYIADPYAQRHHFWMRYAQEHRSGA